jgi:hypothetical protein
MQRRSCQDLFGEEKSRDEGMGMRLLEALAKSWSLSCLQSFIDTDRAS